VGAGGAAVTALRRAVTAFLLLKISVLLVNMAQFPVLRPAGARSRRDPAGPPPGAVSLLVPMRDEAGGLPSTVPGLLRQHAGELILLDDESSDGSGPLAKELLASRPGTRVLHGTPAPPGWTGKSWACHQLAAQAAGSLLVFCDADVLLADGALDAAVTQMRAQRADVFSVFPRQVTATLGEHLITPLIDDVLLCFLPFGLLSADVPSAATASGALLVFTRQAYGAVGGFAAVRGEITEDLAIARRTRAAGLKLGLALGGGLVSTRMYNGYRAVVAGMGRGLLSAAGGSRGRLVAGTGWHLLAYTLPCVLAVRQRPWAFPVLLGMTERALVELKTGRREWWQAVLPPLSPLAALPIVVRALRGTQRWKGRVYP
jgi:cellulose synthase/poly-beta-1,6-N-acetylglucosamine synthase-like glycosyltransferase